MSSNLFFSFHRPQLSMQPSARRRLAGSSIALLVSLLMTLQACDDSGGGGNATAPVSFGVSDAPVLGLLSVVITIDRIVLNRSGADDVVIDRFTSEALGVTDEDTITLDLLDYRGEDNLLIVGPIDLDVADYQNLRLEIIENESFVEELDGAIKPIKVPSGELKLGGFDVENIGDQTFILEFGLRDAMAYNPGPPGPDRYILKPRGVRIVEIGRATTIEGLVDTSLFDTPPCDEKSDPLLGNVVYLYQGFGHDPADLADTFDPSIDTQAAADLIEPFASEAVAEDGSYLFSYLPAGDYTLAFSCDAEADDAEFDDGIVIPTPDGEIFEVSTAPAEGWICDFPVPVDGCAIIVETP